MTSPFFLTLTGVAFFSFCGVAKLLADVPATVQEMALGDGTTEYTVNNTSSSTTSGGRITITLFAVSTTGSNPDTENGWIAQSLNAATRDQSMGIVLNPEHLNYLTWQQYTGLSYTQAFPGDPADVNGYYDLYPYSQGYIVIAGVPFGPGESMSGFLFDGSPGSTFLVAGPTSGSTVFLPGNVVTYSGSSTDVPESAGIGLAAFAISGLTLRGRRTYFPMRIYSSPCP